MALWKNSKNANQLKIGDIIDCHKDGWHRIKEINIKENFVYVFLENKNMLIFKKTDKTNIK